MKAELCVAILLATLLFASPSHAGGCLGHGVEGWKTDVDSKFDPKTYWGPQFAVSRVMDTNGSTEEGSPAAIIVPKKAGSELILSEYGGSDKVFDLRTTTVGGTAYIAEHKGRIIVMAGCVRIYGNNDIYCIEDGHDMSKTSRMDALEDSGMIGRFMLGRLGDNARIIGDTTALLHNIRSVQSSIGGSDVALSSRHEEVLKPSVFEGVPFRLLNEVATSEFTSDRKDSSAIKYVPEAVSGVSADKTLFTTGVYICHAVIVKKTTGSQTTYALLHTLGAKRTFMAGTAFPQSSFGFYSEKGPLTLMAMYLQRDVSELTKIEPNEESIAFFNDVNADTTFTYVIAKGASSVEHVVEGTRAILSDYFGFTQVGEISVDASTFSIGVNPLNGHIFVPKPGKELDGEVQSTNVALYDFPEDTPSTPSESRADVDVEPSVDTPISTSTSSEGGDYLAA